MKLFALFIWFISVMLPIFGVCLTEKNVKDHQHLDDTQ